MPHKFNDANRDKFDKARYRVTNASDYNESLRRRGDLTVWVADDVARDWCSPRRKIRGGQPLYSDLAIEICLTLAAWLGRMLVRKPRMVVAIALANKMARTIWAMPTKGENYRNPMAETLA